MLLTRCPSCRTTFRVTDEAMRKADGHVRCGRCAAVFSAYETLERTTEPPRDESSTQVAATPATPAALEAQPAAQTALAAEAPAGGEPLPQADLAPEERAGDVTFGDLSLAEIIEELGRGEQESEGEESPPTGDTKKDPAAAHDVREPERPSAPAAAVGKPEPSPAPAAAVSKPEPSPAPAAAAGESEAAISPEQVQAVLEDNAPARLPPWQRATSAAGGDARTRWWRYGSVLALALLVLQVVHHFRSDLARASVIGPWLQGTYAIFGVSLVPNWDVQQYQVMDWVATAEPTAHEQGSLSITARIHNRGPQSQPYPHVHLQLKDRWERPVGSRTFRPAEYLTGEARDTQLMAPGETAHARLDVLDPGQDAYGFELDVCVEVEGVALRCANDAVFR